MHSRLLAIFLFIIACAGAGRPAARTHRCIGEFSLDLKAIEPSRANLAAAADHTRRSGCKRTIRVAALVDRRFAPSSLREFGWRMISRIGGVATLAGCESGAAYLTAIPGIIYVKAPDVLHPSMDSARFFSRIDDVHGNVQKDLPRGFTGKGVLVAIFDTEFDTHHPAFLDSNGETRFVAVWNQRDTTQPRQNRFGYGIIKNHAGLEADTAFGQNGGFHGTLMASYAVGGERTRPYYGVAPEARILGVQYAGTDNELIDAIAWAFSIADSLRLPCVINMSIGVGMGPHDGTSLLDRAIDSMSGPGRIVVGAMGNDGDKKAHIAFSLSRNESRGVYVTPSVYVEKGDTIAATAADFWGDSGRVFSVRCRVLDTATLQYQQSAQTVATTANRSYQPQVIVWPNQATGKYDTCVFQISVEQSSPLNRRPHARIYYQSTNPRLFLGVLVSAPLIGNGCTVHGWNGAKAAFRSFGAQGFYDGDNAYSVNEVGGTAKRIIAVGSYVNKVSYTAWDGGVLSHPQNGNARDIATWSSRGPTIDGRVKPDICAPGANVAGAMSCAAVDPGGFTVLWPDHPSVRGRYSMGTGTSVSSPIIAGIIALMLEANPLLTPEQARQILQETAITDAQTGPIISPNNIWGAGKANALGAVRRTLGLATQCGAGRTRPASTPRVHVDAHGIAVFSGFSNRQAIRVEIYDCAGRCVFARSIDATLPLRLPQGLPSGRYALRVSDKERILLNAAISRLPH